MLKLSVHMPYDALDLQIDGFQPELEKCAQSEVLSIAFFSFQF